MSKEKVIMETKIKPLLEIFGYEDGTIGIKWMSGGATKKALSIRIDKEEAKGLVCFIETFYKKQGGG